VQGLTFDVDAVGGFLVHAQVQRMQIGSVGDAPEGLPSLAVNGDFGVVGNQVRLFAPLSCVDGDGFLFGIHGLDRAKDGRTLGLDRTDGFRLGETAQEDLRPGR
jgi:hypothetical protein